MKSAMMLMVFSSLVSGTDWVTSTQFRSHLQALGITPPVMVERGCPTKALKFKATIQGSGKAEDVSYWKGSRQRVPKELVKKAKELLLKAYPPFFIGGEKKKVNTLLEVECLQPLALEVSPPLPY